MSSSRIFKTKGVCAVEIHITQHNGIIEDVRFVGGGCRGQSELISRLLKGRRADEVEAVCSGIPCKGETSCPAQLSEALMLWREGRLPESQPILDLGMLTGSVVVTAHVDGRPKALMQAVEYAGSLGVDTILILGDLTSPSADRADNRQVLKIVSDYGLHAIKGPVDYRISIGGDGARAATYTTLADFPVLMTFKLGETVFLCFHGGFVLDLPGFSELGPFGLEVMAISELSVYLTDQSVFPALESLTDDMTASIVLFAQTRKWNEISLGGRSFINVGPLVSEDAAGEQTINMLRLKCDENGMSREHIQKALQ